MENDQSACKYRHSALSIVHFQLLYAVPQTLKKPHNARVALGGLLVDAGIGEDAGALDGQFLPENGIGLLGGHGRAAAGNDVLYQVGRSDYG